MSEAGAVRAGRGRRVLLMASGRGSTVRAIVEGQRTGRCDLELVGLICDRPEAPVIALADELGIATTVVPRRRGEPRDEWDARLHAAIDTYAPDLIALAGFMRILGPAVVRAFADRILNVHPSLLPAFPGQHAPAAAVEAGVRVAGCTVHLVDEGVDSGRILAQAAVAVQEGDDAASLHARIQGAERMLYPAVLNAYAHGQGLGTSRTATLPTGARTLLVGEPIEP